MAIDFFLDDEEQKNQPAGQSSESTPLSQEGGVIAGAAPGANSDGSKPTSSGTWTNLQNYLSANDGSGFGGQVAGKVQSDVDSAKQSIDSADKGFRSQVDQSTTSYDPELVDSAISDPTSFVQDAGKVSQFDKQRDANYSGPSTLSDNASLYNPASTAVSEAQQETQADRSEGGRMALLDKFYGGSGKSYTQGQKSLDNFLVQSDPTAQAGFDTANKGASDLQNYLSTTATGDQNYASQGRGTTENAQNQTRAALGIDQNGNLIPGAGAIGQNLTAIDQAVTARQNALTQAHQTLDPTNAIPSLSGLTPDQLSAMGIDPSQYGAVDPRTGVQLKGLTPDRFAGTVGPDGYLYGVNPGQFETFANSADINRYTVANPDQQAKLSALARLAGVDDTFITPESGQTAGDLSSAPLYNFNNSGPNGFAQAEATARQNFTNDMQGVINKYNKIASSGGLIAGPSIQSDINQVRAKYGLPPV